MKPRKPNARRALSALVSVLMVGSLGMAGCSNSGSNEASAEQSDAVQLTFSIDDMDLEYTERDQDASYDESAATKVMLGTKSKVAGKGAEASGSDVTITQAGVYVLSGTASDAQVLVNCSDEDAKVQLVLDGVDITCSDGPAIYVKRADKCFVTLAANSKNTLADGKSYTIKDDDGDEEPTAALFSKADLTLQGSGSLTVKGNCNNGIGSKDDLVITGGNYKITAANDGLRGRDCVKAQDGVFKITSQQDAVKSNNDEDTTKGFIKIDGGTWDISAGDDAFHAETAFILNDGDVNVRKCYEGYEGVQVYLNGGTTSITASDDALNAANGSASDAQDKSDVGKNFSHDGAAQGQEGQKPSEGDNKGGDAKAPDASEDSAPGSGGAGGGDMDADASCLIQINGGDITLNAQGDGIDSNGALQMNGGNVVVYGPTSGGDGSLDYGTQASVSGGTIIALGSSGMAQSFSSGTQGFALINANGDEGDAVSVADANGNVLVSTTAAKSYETVVVSCSDMQDGEEYTLKCGDDTTTFTASTEGSSGSGIEGKRMGSVPKESRPERSDDEQQRGSGASESV